MLARAARVDSRARVRGDTCLRMMMILRMGGSGSDYTAARSKLIGQVEGGC